MNSPWHIQFRKLLNDKLKNPMITEDPIPLQDLPHLWQMRMRQSHLQQYVAPVKSTWSAVIWTRGWLVSHAQKKNEGVVVVSGRDVFANKLAFLCMTSSSKTSGSDWRMLSSKWKTNKCCRVLRFTKFDTRPEVSWTIITIEVPEEQLMYTRFACLKIVITSRVSKYSLVRSAAAEYTECISAKE